MTETIPLTPDRSVKSYDFGQSESLSQDNDQTNDSTITASASIPMRDLRVKHRDFDRLPQTSQQYVENRSISRYGNAWSNAMPFSRAKVPNEILPVDSVGWFSNITCSWINRYRVTRDLLQKRANLPLYHRNLVTEAPGAQPKAPPMDSVEVNGRRMKGKYREELQVYGQLKGSMLRVALKFCRTRLIFSTMFHFLAILVGFLGPILFLNLTLHSMRNEFEVENNRTLEEMHKSSVNASQPQFGNNTESRMQFQREVGIPVLDRVGFAVGIALCFFLKTLLLSTSNWINLRTAIRLRTGCLATAFESSMKSVVTYNIAPHQLMTLVTDESEYIVEMIMKGQRFFGTIFSLIISFILAICLLSTPGMWPLFVVFGLLILAFPLAKISTFHLRKSMSHLARKLTVIEEFCLYFRDIVIFGNMRTTKKNFLNAAEEQYSSSKWSSIFSTNFSGKLTSAMLLGGLYMMWCDPQVQTESIDVLTLVILYAFIVQNYVAEYFQSLGAIFNGKSVMNKLMNIYNLKSSNAAKRTPKSYRVISIYDKEFKWHSSNENFSKKDNPHSKEEIVLKIKEFYVASDQIVGITGPPKSGKSMLLYSILGHTEHLEGVVGLSKGDFQKRGKLAFFPENCALSLGSLKDNILMGADFDEKLFYEAVHGAQLNDIFIRPGIEDEDIGSLELSIAQLDKITLAQAIYTNRNIILLDNPMSRYSESTDGDIFRLFNNFFNILRNQKKTVVLATQDHNFLALCGRIYIMDDCSVVTELNYHDLESYPNYENWSKSYGKLRNVINAERFDGCNSAGISPMVKKNSQKPKRHQNGDGAASESEQVLIDKDKGKESSISIGNFVLISLFLGILHLFISGSYITLPGYIILAQILPIELWISLISFGFICVSFLMELIDRFYTSRISEKFSMKQDKDKLKLLLSTSMNFLYNSSVSDLIYIFMENSQALIQAHRNIINRISLILVATGFLGFTNPWTIIVIVLLSVVCTWIYIFLKTTVEEFYKKEFEVRRKMFRHITNCIRTREVYGTSSRAFRSLYNLLEDNSTLLFIRKCTVNYAQFLMNIFLALGFFCTCCLMLLLPNASLDEQKLRYTYGILLYLIIARNFQEIIQNGLFDRVVVAKNAEILSDLVHDLDRTGSSDVVESVSDYSKSLTVSFMNVTCKMGNIRKLDIKDVHVNAGEKVGILMDGSHLLVPMLGRVLTPRSGVIFFGQKDIASFPDTIFCKIVGFISSNLQPSSATILSIIDPYSERKEKDLMEALRYFELGQKISILPKKLKDTISNLTADEKQILCLVKIWLERPIIVVVENPHPDALNKINSTINDSFKDATVIKIATSQHQLISCNRIL